MHVRTRGLLAIAAASLFFGTMSVLVKIVTADDPASLPVALAPLASSPASAAETVFARSLIGWLVLLVVARLLGIRRTRERTGFLLLRGVLGGLAILCLFHAIAHTQMSKAVMLVYAYPIWATLFARLFLGERLRPGTVLLMAVALGGVVLVLRPAPGGAFNAGDATALLASIFSGGAVTTLRRLRRDEATLTVVVYFTFWCTLLSLPAMAATGVRVPDGPHAALWVGIAAVSAGGQLLLTYGYKHCSASEGSTMSLLNVVVAVAFGVLLLREDLTGTTWAGGALTLAACLGMLRVQVRGERRGGDREDGAPSSE